MLWEVAILEEGSKDGGSRPLQTIFQYLRVLMQFGVTYRANFKVDFCEFLIFL